MDGDYDIETVVTENTVSEYIQDVSVNADGGVYITYAAGGSGGDRMFITRSMQV